ncbi:MAG: hypothetical protein ACREOS_11970, partial [Candidatus Dormibacteraceae bacterium]
ATSPYRWAPPPDLDVEQDPLQLRLDFHRESVLLHDFVRGLARTKVVSALDVAHALARELDLSTGLLPVDTLWWARTASGVRVAIWREPRVWTVRLRERFDAKPRRLRSLDDQLFHCPTYNVFDSGRVCPGSHAFPADPAKIPEDFFASHFSVTGDTACGKSRRYPDEVGKL